MNRIVLYIVIRLKITGMKNGIVTVFAVILRLSTLNECQIEMDQDKKLLL